MKPREQSQIFTAALNDLINRHVAEFDIEIHTIVGILEDKKLDLLLGEYELDVDELDED